MPKPRTTWQVPANTLAKNDMTEYGTVQTADTVGGTVYLSTEGGDYEVPSTDYVWITTAHLVAV